MNHVDRVRAFLRHVEQTNDRGVLATCMEDTGRDSLTHRWVKHELTTADLDALCRDAERLAEIEDL